jgi:uncharacterized protein (TIGR03437 family)
VQANAIAVDSAGHAFIAGTALILDPLPVTPGAYQTRFGGQFYGGGIAPVPQPQNGFLTEFDSAGASLIFSTYLGTQSESAGTVVLLKDESIVVASRGQGNLYHLDRTGSTLLGKKTLLADVRALAVDSAGNLLAAGVSGYSAYDPPFPTTQGAFQTALYSTPSLPGTVGNAGIGDAFITRFDPQLNITESTLLGGESSDVALAVASDSAGNIMAGGSTYSKAFPSRGPLQASFSPATGFLAQLNPDLSTLLFSTFAGDTRPFYVRSLVTLPDGGIVIGGSTAPYSYFDGVFPDPTTQTFLVRIDRIQPAAPRIDAVVNAASRLGVPLSPGETIQVRGDGFGDDATLWLNGTPLALHSHTATALTATIPADIHQDVVSVEVRSGAGRTAIPVPVAAASPGVFSQDGTGLGQGYILNKDGTLNSPGNPAMEGDPITIFATGVGSMTFDRGYAVTGAVVDVRVDGFSAAGIAAILGPVDGLPGDVYQISVFVPHPADFAVYNPNLIGFIMPPQVAVTLRINGATSQAGIALSVTH